MAAYNQFNQSTTQDSDFMNQNSAVENKGIFSRILRNLSTYGMNYNDMIIRNQVGVGINEDPYSAKGNSMYDFFSKRAVASVLNRKSIPYLDKSYSDKSRILREYSIKDELRDFVSTICDEAIVYDDESDFCSPKPLSNSHPEEVKDKYQEYFEKIYNANGFSDNITAWNMMKDFLIDGFLATEIIYDDKKKNIEGFNRMRPETLVPAYEPQVGHLWIQYPEDPQLRRIFLDSQVIFISYSTQNDYSETSYVEGLIKPYNQLKILEQTKIMFNVLNAQVYQKFTVPVKGLSRQRAEEQIGQLINDYSEEIEFDDTLGTLTMNGQKHLHYNKQIWFPEGEAGTPNMELVKQEGHDLNEETMLNYFNRNLKRASKIPMQRFEYENGGGNLFSDSSEMTRDEIKFNNFIRRLRANFKEIVVKPLKLQMLIEFPELKDDNRFINEMDIVFNTNQLFEEWKKINNMSKRADVVSTLQGIQKSDQQPYFHIEWIMDNVFKLTPEEKAENERYWAKDSNSSSDEQGEESGMDMDSPDSDMGGGIDDGPNTDNSSDIDSDMDNDIPDGGDEPDTPDEPDNNEGGGDDDEFTF